jgi:hypothetical protein
MMVSDVARMRKTQYNELQLVILVLEARKQNKKKNIYFQSKGST